jgi:hypothetical protein
MFTSYWIIALLTYYSVFVSRKNVDKLRTINVTSTKKVNNVDTFFS